MIPRLQAGQKESKLTPRSTASEHAHSVKIGERNNPPIVIFAKWVNSQHVLLVFFHFVTAVQSVKINLVFVSEIGCPTVGPKIPWFSSNLGPMGPLWGAQLLGNQSDVVLLPPKIGMYGICCIIQWSQFLSLWWDMFFFGNFPIRTCHSPDFDTSNLAVFSICWSRGVGRTLWRTIQALDPGTPGTGEVENEKILQLWPQLPQLWMSVTHEGMTTSLGF
jgi:hypothetical protein